MFYTLCNLSLVFVIVILEIELNAKLQVANDDF